LVADSDSGRTGSRDVRLRSPGSVAPWISWPAAPSSLP